MNLYIDFNYSFISENQVLNVSTYDVDCFYSSSTEIERLNFFFVLLNTFHLLSKKSDNEKAAHISYLISYYLFTALTPPGSESLALYYGECSISLSPLTKYKEWLLVVKNGN